MTIQISPYWYIVVIPAIMFSILGGLMIYGYFGEHKIYNETITIKTTGYCDGQACIEDSNLSWYDFNDNSITWKQWLNLESNNVMEVQIRKNVYGDKEIIKVWKIGG